MTELAGNIIAVSPPQGWVDTALAQVSCCSQAKLAMLVTGGGIVMPQKAKGGPGIVN